MLEIAIKAAKEGGKILMKYYGNIQAEYKEGRFEAASVVTKADIESEKKIVEILKTKFPEHNIFSEEKIRENNGSEYTWYIDPLDGTSNFRSIILSCIKFITKSRKRQRSFCK